MHSLEKAGVGLAPSAAPLWCAARLLATSSFSCWVWLSESHVSRFSRLDLAVLELCDLFRMYAKNDRCTLACSVAHAREAYSSRS